MAIILDGSKIADLIIEELRNSLHQESVPGLTVLLCSNDEASKVYVKKKQDACKRIGIKSSLISGLMNEETLIQHIQALNNDPKTNGILVQLPLPNHFNKYKIFDTIEPKKDVDCFHPYNIGLLSQNRARFVPCTPRAVQILLHEHNMSVIGKKVTIINRSDIVGKPLQNMLIQDNLIGNATVCLCHDKTPHETLVAACQQADIIVVAVGKPNFLTVDMVSEHSVVVDVGINRVNGKICGDVDFLNVSKKVKAISPCPGGIGPLTVSVLMQNTYKAWELANG